MTEGELPINQEARLIRAICAGCQAADIHLECSFPSCKCKQTPQIVKAAIDNWEKLPDVP